MTELPLLGKLPESCRCSSCRCRPRGSNPSIHPVPDACQRRGLHGGVGVEAGGCGRRGEISGCLAVPGQFRWWNAVEPLTGSEPPMRWANFPPVASEGTVVHAHQRPLVVGEHRRARLAGGQDAGDLDDARFSNCSGVGV